MVAIIEATDFGRTMLEQLERLENDCHIKLSRFQKLLLAEKGSVEQLLSIIVNSPITVEVVKQQTKGPTIDRQVWLRDREGNDLIFAHTTYDKWKLTMTMLDDLLVAQMGIGSAIMKYSLETYRRIKMVGYNEETKMLSREYEIVKDGTVLFDIKEYFSIESFKE